MPLLRVALMPHPGKNEALVLASSLIERLAADGIDLWLEPAMAERLGRREAAGDMEDFKQCQVAVVLGGDGALLKAARLAAPHGVPIVGVNFGQLGFLTAVEPAGIDVAVQRIIDGDFDIEERLMLSAQAMRQGRQSARLEGLNDAVVARGPFARVLEFEVFVNDYLAGRFLADGVIVSTPTGSTGYSLSAGGPIVNPGVEALIVTPICPHTIGARGFVTRPDESVRIRVVAPKGDAMLTVDGQVGQALEAGDEVIVGRAAQSAKFVNLGERNFYTLLHQRLRQGNG